MFNVVEVAKEEKPASVMAEREDLQRSVIIGLGGTGKTVLTRLKARLHEIYDEVPDRIKLLLFDIDGSVEVEYVGSKPITLAQEEEWFRISGVPAESIMNQMRDESKWPELQSWFQRDQTLNELTLEKGGQGNRQLGRLALFWHFDQEGSKRIATQISSAMTKVMNVGAAEPGFGTSGRTQSINFIIVSSLCGGTGAGMFIDTGFIIQHVFDSLFKEKAASERKRYTTAFLVSPLVITQEHTPLVKLNANACAALEELDYFMREDKGKVFKEIVYQRGRPVNCTKKPFDICYFLDAVSAEGGLVTRQRQAADLLSEAILLLVGSKVGDTAWSEINNISELRGENIYSTFGVASWSFPLNELERWCAAKVCAAITQEELLGDVSGDQEKSLETDVSGFLTGNKLNVDGLYQQLSVKEDGTPVLGEYKDDERLQNDAFDTQPKPVWDRYAAGIIKDLLPVLYSAATKHVEGLTKARDSKTVAVIRGRILNDPAIGLLAQVRVLLRKPAGLAYARRFIESLQGRLKAVRDDLNKQINAIEAGQDNANAAFTKAKERFENAARKRQRFLIGWMTKLLAPREEYIRQAQVLLQANFDLFAYRECVPLVADLDKNLSDLWKRLTALEQNLRDAQREYFPDEENKALSEINNLPARRRQVVTSRKDMEKIYTENQMAALENMKRELEGDKDHLYKLMANTKADEVGKGLMDIAKDVMRPMLSRYELEDMILETVNEDQLASLVHQLKEGAGTFCEIDEALRRSLNLPQKRVQVIGVKDRNKTIMTRYASGNEYLVSTGDTHAISVLAMQHAFSLRLMVRYNSDYRRDYRMIVQDPNQYGSAHRHVFPEFNLGGEHEKRAFVLAWALGLIKRYVDTYTYVGKGGENIELGQSGLVEAMRGFAINRDLVECVSKAVDVLGRDAIDKDRAAFKTRLRQFAKEGLSFKEDEILLEELRNLLEAYADKL